MGSDSKDEGLLPASPPLLAPSISPRPQQQQHLQPLHLSSPRSPLPLSPRTPRTPTAGPSTPLLKSNDLTLLPLAPLPHHLHPFLLPDSPLSPEQKTELFTNVFLRSASSGNSDTLEWLLSVPSSSAGGAEISHAAARRFSASSLSLNRGARIEETLPDTAPRKWVNIEATDEDGNTALGMCVALGHAEGVRVLIEGGASVTAGDKAGWTPLHWAVQNNDIPIASYLLNHRSSPSLASHKGLTPKDLVKRGREGAAMRDVLKSGEEAAFARDRMERFSEDDEDEMSPDMNAKGKEREDGRPSSRASLVPSIASGAMPWEQESEKVDEEKRERENQKRMELAKISAMNMEVDLNILSLDGRGTLVRQEDQEDEEGIPNAFIWDECLPDQMLVFTMDDLGIIFDVVITNMKPVRAKNYRVTPANVIFLCARYAHYHGGSEALEELFLQAIERIEAAVHHRPNDMANCAFWLSNCLLLLYYVRKEPNLAVSSAEYQVHLCDLINEIFVFVIRDAERRIDRVLEAAILEHEPLPGFEDVQFEGDWSSNRFMKKLTGGRKKAIPKSTSAMSLFSTTSAASSEGGKDGTGSPEKLANGTIKAQPSHVTSLLSSTLFILQVYDIPPSIVVQAFSQLFYWISCEVFNRLLTNKKFLCRSKALQIRMNTSSLEDWSRLNRMPSKMVPAHFAPLDQLLQWLQCLSSESSIDGLIGTIQSLNALNPLQLRKAVREYRYEVDEPHMGEDCDQYLLQIQKQWERLRVQKAVEEVHEKEGTPSGSQASRPESPTSSVAESVQSDVARMIDSVFSDPSSFGHYTPPGATESLGELLNSRYMLPFAVPSAPHMLVNFRDKEAFGPFASHYPAPPSIGNLTPRTQAAEAFATSSRRTSLANGSGRRFSLALSISSPSSICTEDQEALDPKFVPVLPDEFFTVLDAAKAEAEGHPLDSTTTRNQGLGFDLDHDPEGPENGLDDENGEGGGVNGQGKGEGWFDWRRGMPTDEELEAESDEDGGIGQKMMGLGLQGQDDDEITAAMMENTPRPREKPRMSAG